MSLLASMPSPPDGDPAAMQAFARTLMSIAETWAKTGSGAAGAVAGITFVGPAGDLAKSRADQLRARSEAAAGELRWLADEIMKRAALVAEARQAWEQERARRAKLDAQQALQRVR